MQRLMASLGVTLVAAFALLLCLQTPQQAARAQVQIQPREVPMPNPAAQSGKPRKVIVGTCMFSMFGAFPGFDQRLNELAALVDDMDKKAKQEYGPDAHLDLAVLPEYGVTSGKGGPAKDRCVSLQGKVLDFFAAKARQYNTYLIVAMELADDAPNGYYNAAALLDRQGKLVGIYRKIHPVAVVGSKTFEGGMAPGTQVPVFDTDFGRIGIQICYDMSFDDGWDALQKQGAELVAWPSQSPATILPAARALKNKFFIVSSTWRDNCSLIDPTGMVIGQITKPQDRVLVDKIDLSYALLPWQAKLQDGKLFTEKYGDKAGYRYSAREDGGIFWSNDPDKPIAQMVRELGLVTESQDLDYNAHLREKAVAEKGAN